MKRSKTAHIAGTASAQQMMRSRSSASTGPARRSAPNRRSISNTVAVPPTAIPSTNASSGGPVGILNCFAGHGQFQQPMVAPIHDAMSFSTHPWTHMANASLMPSREMEVAEYLLMRDEDDLPTSPIAISPAQHLSPSNALHYGSNSGIPSLCGSMSSGPTLETAPMSRVNSSLNDNPAFMGRFHDMVRINSHQSFGDYPHHDGYGNAQQVMHHDPSGKPPATDNDFLGIGANLSEPIPYYYQGSVPPSSSQFLDPRAMQRSASQESSTSSSADDLFFKQEYGSPFFAPGMERSTSNDSAKSNASLLLRAKEALSRQNGNASKSRHLQPKPAPDTVKQEAIESVHSREGDGKAAISKAKYERPKHAKVFCPLCNEVPEGFRGDHELRRHNDAKHKTAVKKWVCRDPTLEGIPHEENAARPLSDCKHCSQKKQYGAYYNAAAHLRRTHFSVKPSRKGRTPSKHATKGSDPADEPAEKRGGKGGGDWPSMNELKQWMVEVIVPADQNMPQDGPTGATDPDHMDDEHYDFHYDINVAGGNFSPDLIYLQAQFGGFSAQTEFFAPGSAMCLPSTMQNFPISPSGFGYAAGPDQQQHNTSSSLGLDSRGYTSSTSPTATVTQGVLYGNRQIFPAPAMLQPRDDDTDEMSFDMTFVARP